MLPIIIKMGSLGVHRDEPQGGCGFCTPWSGVLLSHRKQDIVSSAAKGMEQTTLRYSRTWEDRPALVFAQSQW